MNRLKKRAVSLLLAAIMLLGLFPPATLTVRAADESIKLTGCDFTGIITRKLSETRPSTPWTAYVEFLQATDKAASTVKTDLAAIRFFHDKMDNAKYRLPNNGELSVELAKRSFGGTGRTWSAEEFDKMFAIAFVSGQSHYACALALARFAGLRLHECFRIDTATARQALREKAITIKGKEYQMARKKNAQAFRWPLGSPFYQGL